MKGHEQIISILNQILRMELTGINQYLIHYKMCKHWGYAKLAKQNYDESIDEMKHADEVIDRILFLEGEPNLQAYDKIQVGTTVRDQLKNDLSLEMNALTVLDTALQKCAETGDTTTRELVERIKRSEEEHIGWIEEQFHLIDEVGYELWLASMM